MRSTGICLLYLATLLVSSDLAAAQVPCESERKVIADIIDSGRVSASIETALEREYEKQNTRGIGNAYCVQIRKSVESLQRYRLKVSPERFIKQAVQFESFRLDTFISSGVAPKKYFGFFDEMGDTAKYEGILRETVIDVAEIIARHGVQDKLGFAITEKEIAVTFLAEGGALLLTNPEDSPDRVHPVRGIGLDDYRKGFDRFPALVRELDDHFGTRLNNLLLRIGGTKILLRPMTFREAILGTAVMYLYEKEIAVALMRAEWKTEVSSLPPDSQFIATSLVYNSGIAFAPERIDQIQRFDTADYLDTISKNSRRLPLSLSSSAESLAVLKRGEALPLQLTSWNAVYHILQRYGAWVAIEQFSSTFEQGRFRNREKNLHERVADTP